MQYSVQSNPYTVRRDDIMEELLYSDKPFIG